MKKKRSTLHVRWRLAERIIDTAEEVRNANKAADLSFPESRLIDLVIQMREHKYEWLEKSMGLNTQDRGRWPRL